MLSPATLRLVARYRKDRAFLAIYSGFDGEFSIWLNHEEQWGGPEKAVKLAGFPLETDRDLELEMYQVERALNGWKKVLPSDKP